MLALPFSLIDSFWLPYLPGSGLASVPRWLQNF